MEKAKVLKVNGGYPLHTFEEVEDIYSVYITSSEDRQRIKEAYEFILEKHSGQLRKSGEPYYHHLLEVAYILAELHCGPNTIISGFLHDVVEDTNYTIDDIKKEFGDKVAGLVASESENKRPELPEEETWKIRKEETLEHLKDASIETKIVTLGDKLSNIRAIYRDYLELGDRLWDRFNQKDKSEHAWYYSSIADLLSDLNKYPAWKEYKDLVNRVFGE